MSPIDKELPRLLVLASTYPRWRDDPEPSFVHELSRRLTEDFRVTVLCPHAPGAQPLELLEGVEIVRYRYAPEGWETLVNDGGIVTNLRNSPWKLLLVPGFVLAQAWRARILCKKYKIDVVHAHWLIPQGVIAAIMPLLLGRRVPFVVTSHGADLFALRGALLTAVKRFVLSHAAAATVVSEAMREAVSELGADLSKIRTISMGVDMTHRFVPEINGVRSDSELLFVGRLVEKKGLRHLLDAMPLVLQVRPDVTLTVAGFGPQEMALRAQARALGLDREVRFLGPVAQAVLPLMYQRAAMFVAPFVQARSGDQEGLGLVLVEALACGCPVLAGNVPAVHDVLASLDSRFVVDPHDPHLLARRILAMLEDHHQVLVQVAEARSSVSERFDWWRVSARYAALLKSVA